MNPRTNIAIVCPRIVGTFIHQDALLLRSAFDVTVVSVSGARSVFALRSALSRADVVMIWFLGRHAIPAILYARLRGIPVISVIGGFEVAWEPDIGYGVRPGSLRELSLHRMLAKSSSIITVSEFSHTLAVSRFPDLADRMKLIHNAVDTDRFSFSGGGSRTGVVCVASLSRGSIKVKNLGMLKEIASAMPEESFTLVGPTLDDHATTFVRSLPPNMKWSGALSGQDLVAVYQRSSVYIQISRHESFSLALAESMACGCIPVVSEFGALPEVGGPRARVVSPLTIENGLGVIIQAMHATESERLAVRQHIVSNFGTARRAEKLVSLFRVTAGT